jgi:hypothetical protein
MKVWSVTKIWSVPGWRGVAAAVLTVAVLGGGVANWLATAGGG